MDLLDLLDRRRASLALVLAVAAGCGGNSTGEQATAAKNAAAEAPTKAEGPKADTKAEPEPVPDDDGEVASAVDWFHGTLEAALAKAKAEDKLVFVDIGAYWCPPCHRLDEEVFSQAEVGEFLGDGYVALHIDAEKGEGPELEERYDVMAFPTMLVLEASGVEKGRVVDFLPPDELIAALTRLAKGDNVLATLEADAEASPDDVNKRYKLGHAYALAAAREQAEQAFDDVLVADPKNELGLASKVHYDRALFITYKLDGKLDEAIAQFQELQKRYPDSKEAVRAYEKIGRLLNQQGKVDEAIASLDAMLATDPDSASLHSSYGWFSFRQKCRPERGLEVVNKGIELAPDSADLHFVSAELHAATGDPAGALAAIRKASQLEPESNFYKRMVQRFSREAAEAGAAAG